MGLIQILYKGTVLTQIPISISLQGHLIKAALSGAGHQEVQVCHMWKQSKVGASDMGGTAQDSATDGTLQIRYVPSAVDELLEGDFITLEHVAIFNVKSTNDGEITIIPSSPVSSVGSQPPVTGGTRPSTLVLTGFAPTVIVPIIQPSAGTLTMVDRASKFISGMTPLTASLEFTTAAPDNAGTFHPVVGSLIFTGVAPTVLTPLIQPSVATLTLTTTTPTVIAPILTPSVGSLAIIGTTARTEKSNSITPSVRSMTLSGKQASVVEQGVHDWYVSTTGSDSNPGTLAAPFLTIGYAITIMSGDDTLYIRGGTYSENLPQSSIPAGSGWSSPTTIRAYPSETVILTGSSPGHYNSNQSYIWWDGIIFDTPSNFVIANGAHHIKMTNFEIKNSADNGMFIQGGGHIISNGTIHDIGSNPSGPPHAIYTSSDNSLYENLLIYNNPNGGGLHFYGSNPGIDSNLIQNVIVHDMASFGILLSLGTDCQVRNCLSYNNGTHGVHIFGSSNSLTKVYNNTTYGNASYGIIVDAASSYALNGIYRNNIAYGNSVGQITTSNDSGATVSNNLTTDPLFVNPGVDFHLQAGSNAIGTGYDLSAIFTTDIEGTTRTVPWDIGAYKA